MDTPLKRTPLFEAHVEAGARMVPFGGWEMPVQYSGIVEEHRTVRAAVGCFDVSHMGEFEVEGPGALPALQRLTTNDVAALEIGQIQYSVLCHAHGGIVDDLTVYRLAADRYLVTVNAGNIAKDWTHVTTHGEGARWRDVSDATGLIAVQGPKAEALVGRLADVDVTRIGYYRFAPGKVAGVVALVSRTGYTGEDGFELYAAAVDTERLWNALLDAGRADGVAPIGLGARDTLRLEMTERAVARHGYPVVKDGARTGVVTSGSYGPSVDRYIALAYVGSAHAAIGTELGVEIRGQVKSARV